MLLAAVTLNGFAHAGELHVAARVCDADRVREALLRHPALNEKKDAEGRTAVEAAVALLKSIQATMIGIPLLFSSRCFLIEFLH